MLSDYKVQMVSDGMKEFFAEFKGPTESNNPCAESQFLPLSASKLMIHAPISDLDVVGGVQLQENGKIHSFMSHDICVHSFMSHFLYFT